MLFAVAGIATLLTALIAAWGTTALWYQAPGGRVRKALWMLLWSAAMCLAAGSIWLSHYALGTAAFVLPFAGLLTWWVRIPPSNDRIWADDVARMTNGSCDGGHVTLRNVRNFAWRSRTDYTQSWETRGYELAQLESVDMILSYWRGPAIAHMLISFGFGGGQHVVFSVEIRRERNEAFSEVGGFFKQFELSIIACDERDVVRVRTNIRGEDAYLYRLAIPRSAMRSLFLGYIEQANGLLDAPRFYNTITVNCTTLVYHMMKRIVGFLPLDFRMLLTGHLASYVYRVGGLDQRYSLQQLRSFGRITQRARAADASADFSRAIRHGIPPVSS